MLLYARKKVHIMFKSASLLYEGVRPFSFHIKYTENTVHEILEGAEQHVHPECEIYINLSGDVSFMVEDKLYPIEPGSIIVTRPFEYHHCVYNSDAVHRHFWILFSSEGNESLLPAFFDRQTGCGNLRRLNETSFSALLENCRALTFESETNITRYKRFFTVLSLIEGSAVSPPHTFCAPKDEVDSALVFLSVRFTQPVTAKELAAYVGVSVNTLERNFTRRVGMTPFAYLKEKRLLFAAELLKNGARVTEAAGDAGFTDDSRFIKAFKEKFGMTPLAYKKSSCHTEKS